MNKFATIIALFLLSIATSGCAQKLSPEDQQLRRDIAEMLLVGFRGTDLDSSNHIIRDVQEYGVGGVILFEYDAPSSSRPRNITSQQQLKTLCSQLQALSSETLLIGIDQEGGRVNRLKSTYGFPRFASAKQTALSGDDSVRYYARLTAKTLHNLGINLNFAPCVDVDINPKCPVIGKIERSFSANPARVAHCAQIWIDEQSKQGVISCPKHFPGHGSSKSDTHSGFADVTETWNASELRPYQDLIATGKVQMIMTTHVFNGTLDSVYPATLSHYTLTDLLRNQLNYKGLIITDDLAMGAMVNQYDYDFILQQAILAGADLLCLSNNGHDYNPDMVPEAVDIIFRKVKNGEIPRQRIQESAARIRALKQTL